MNLPTLHRIVIGDSRKMALIPDDSIHLIVTSPPYWQLKDYGTENQIGFDDSYEQYVNNLNLVWQESKRVLYDGCRLCINIGDQFARAVYYGRYKVIPIRTEIIRFCETIGLDFMGSIIWQKVTTCNTTGGASIMGSFPYPRNGIVKIDYEFILLFKKQGKAPVVSKETKQASVMSTDEWNKYFNGHWNFSGEKQSGHIAMFPEELPRRLIKMFSFVGETVLDPFLGSGTTSLAAMKLGRNSVGFEINPDYRDIIDEKLEKGADLFTEADVRYETDTISGIDHSVLPYYFIDPLVLDKKVDPRTLSFGSKVSASQKKSAPEYLKVASIISADQIFLENNIKIKLMGVTPKKDMESEAMTFLNNKVRGKQVYLRFDSVKYDEEKRLLAYVYLKNRTFVNAHLIKYGFANLDSRHDVSNKSLLKLGDKHAKRVGT